MQLEDEEGSLPSLSHHPVAIVTESSWFEPPRIRHQVARQMARFTRVLFVETPTDWRRVTRSAVQEVAPNIFQCILGNPQRIPRRVHLYLDRFRASLNRHYLRELFGAAPGYLHAPPVLINFNYDFTEGVRSPRFAAAIYYCNDEFTTWAPDALARRTIQRRERATAAAADCCLTVSTPLTRKIAQWNPRTQTLLPGHDFAERWPAPRRTGPIRVAYMGYLDGRIHYDWLATAARQSDMEIHLIGPVVRQADDIRELMALPTVVSHGTRVGLELQDLLLEADVLVLPYIAAPRSGMLAASAPNKLFSYLAVAKPVIVSDLPALISLDEGLLYRATSAETFVAAIRRAFGEDSDVLRERRLAVARDNTWTRRGDTLRVLIETELARRHL